MKSLIVKVVVNNYDIDDDDIDLIKVDVTNDVTTEDVMNALKKADKYLKSERNRDGDTLYDWYGHNYITLMDTVKEFNGWDYEKVSPNIEINIS